MTRWTYLVGDLMTQQVLDELPLTAVRMSKTVNGSGQLSANLQLGNTLTAARDCYDLTTPVRRCIYAIRDGQPWWGGIIWARDYDSSSRVVQVGCADFWSYFDHRKILPVLSAGPWATNYVAGLSQLYAATDQNAIARGLVTLAQSHTGGNIGMTVDSGLSGILLDRTWNGFDLDYMGDALRDLSQLQNGPDIIFDLAGFDANNRPVRLMRTGTPRLGQQGTAHRFDLGGNLMSYTWSSGGGAMATRAFAQGDGTERGTLIAVAEDATKYADGWPLLETDDIYDGVTDDATLNADAQTLLGALKVPVATPKLVVRGDRTPGLGDYGPGDDCQLVIPPTAAGVTGGDPFFTAGLTLTVRILGIEVAVADNGDESITLTCQAQTAVI